MKKILFILCSIVGYCAIGSDNFWLYDSAAKTMTWVDETGFENVVKTSGDDGSSIVIKEDVNRATKAIRNLDLSLPIRDASGNEYVITEFVGSSLSAFGYNSSITNVVLPSGLKTLSPFAFKNCSGLISVTLNDGLEIIGAEAFSGCSALKQIYNFFPSSLVEIKSKAFYSCSALECGAVISGVTNMADRIFHSSSVRSFDCEQAPLKILPEFTFYNCKQLTNVVLSQDLEVIKEGCFQNCYALTSVKNLLPKSLTKLGNGESYPVFFDNKALEGELFIGPYLEEISYRTFRGSKIGSVVAAKNGLKTLGQYCFYACNDLTNIVLSATIEKLDYSILGGTANSTAQRKIYLRNFPSGGITSSLFNETKTEHITVYLPWEYREEWRNFAATNTEHTFTFNGETKVLPTLKTELGTWKATYTQKVGWWQESPDPSLIFIK
jgi:hypothetical protein